MKKDDISLLLQRYLSAKQEGKDLYFDADQIEDMLDSFEESDDYTYFDEVLALGLRLHPSSTNLQIRLCRQYVYNEDFDSALALMDYIAETNNQDLDLMRLECYNALEKYEKVVEYTDYLISKNCDYLEPVFEYVIPILNDLEMFKEVQRYIDLGITMFPNNILLKNELCYTLEAEGELEKAINVCNDLLNKVPYSYEYWFTLGRLNSMIGEYEKAIDAFDFALACDDSEEELYILKAYCLYMNESYEMALETYSYLLNSEESALRVKPLMAECYIKMGNFEKGYELLKEDLKSDTQEKDPASYINFIRCCMELGYDKEASNTLFKAAEIFPYNLRILSLLALSFIENGREDLAMNTLNRIFYMIKANDLYDVEENLENLLRTGEFFYLKGDLQEALKFYKKAYELNPKLPIVHLHLAVTYLALGDLNHFKEHLNQFNHKEVTKDSSMENEQFLREYEELVQQKHIPLENLVKEFLKNKDNCN